MSDKDPSDVRLRSVRSFVLRAGRATAGQQRALTQLWPKYGVEFSPTALTSASTELGAPSSSAQNGPSSVWHAQSPSIPLPKLHQPRHFS